MDNIGNCPKCGCNDWEEDIDHDGNDILECLDCGYIEYRR